MGFSEIVSGIYKLEVPFEDIYTAVFLVRGEDGYAVVDSATTDADAEEIIFPALRAIVPTDAPTVLLLSHPHGDHAGGARRLTELLPNLPVYAPCAVKGIETLPMKAGEMFLGRLRVVPLPGHTESSCGFYDRETGTLLSCDCLQLRGVSRYTKGIKYPEKYRGSVERLYGMEIERILASHEYVPLGSVAEGRESVRRYLDECLAVL